MAVPANMWECPKCGDYVENYHKTCPHCAKVGQGNTSQPKVFSPSSIKSSESKTEEKWVMQPAYTSDGSWASKFLKVIAVILFVGGLVVAYMSGKVEIDGYYSKYNDFSWAIFIETYLIYGLLGCFTLCASELFENIQRIADALSRMEIKKNK